MQLENYKDSFHGLFEVGHNDSKVYDSKIHITLWSYEVDVDTLTDSLLTEYETIKKIRTKVQREQYFKVLKVIICNLAVNKIQHISFSSSKTAYSTMNVKYNPLGFTYDIQKNLIEFLHDTTLVNRLNGYWAEDGSGKRGTIKATEELLCLFEEFDVKYKSIDFHRSTESISLEQNKRLVNYKDTKAVSARRKVLFDYRELLNSTVITLDGKEQGSLVLPRSMYKKSFNNGSRIYGGCWQNCKSELREIITINGKKTVEIDIIASSITLAKHLSGIEVTEDPYAIKDYPRKIVKLAIVIMIGQSNSYKSEAYAIAGTVKALAEKFPAQDTKYLKKIVIDILEYHSDISFEWFYRNKSTEYMHYESLVCQKVIEEFTSLSKVVLTVHDSYIVAEEDKDLLKLSIEKHYSNILSYTPRLKEE